MSLQRKEPQAPRCPPSLPLWVPSGPACGHRGPGEGASATDPATSGQLASAGGDRRGLTIPCTCKVARWRPWRWLAGGQLGSGRQAGGSPADNRDHARSFCRPICRGPASRPATCHRPAQRLRGASATSTTGSGSGGSDGGRPADPPRFLCEELLHLARSTRGNLCGPAEIRHHGGRCSTDS